MARGRPKKSLSSSPAKSASSSKVGKENKKKSVKDARNFRRYIHLVLKNIHEDISIGQKAMKIMNDFMNDIFERLTNEAAGLYAIQNRKANRTTLISSDMQAAVRLVIPGELCKHAASRAVTAIEKFYKSKGK